MKLRLFILACVLSCALSALAQSASSGSSTESGGSSDFPGQNCSIQTQSLPTATLNTAYSANVDTAFCVPALTFSFTGSLPNGLGLDPVSGAITGTPTIAGNFSFTVSVIDSTSHSAIFPTALSIAAVTTTNGVLPPDPALTAWDTSMAGTPTDNVTVCVGTPMNPAALPGGQCSTQFPGTTAGLQSALNALACGQIINISNAPGYGAQTLPRVNCSPAHYWWITGDLSDTTFPSEGVRPDPSYVGIPQYVMPWYPYPGANGTPNLAARHMPQIIVPASSNNPCFKISTPGSGASTPSLSYGRIQRIECTRDQSSDDVTALIDLNFQPAASGQDCALTGTGNTALPVNALACKADQPNHLVISQNVIHGDAQRQTTRGISLGGGQFIRFKDNFGYDIQTTVGGDLSSDAEFYAGGFGHGYTGPGFWMFDNDFTASSTEGNLYCGAFTEAKSPVTNADGIPTNVIWDHHHFYKPIVWDPQRGQTLNDSLVNAGSTYPPVGDQELIVSPSTLQIQQGTSFQLNTTWQNDSGGGWNHYTDAGGTGSVTVDTLATSYVTTTTVGSTPAGTSVVVLSATGWAIGQQILIPGAAAGGNNYLGVVSGISGTTFTVAPATTLVVGNGTQVINPLSLPGVNSAGGGILKNPQHVVGVTPWKIGNAVTYQYVACSGVNSPAGCTGATTVGSHTVVFNRTVIDDGRDRPSCTPNCLALLGGNRTLTATVNITVTAAPPVNQIALSPSAPDLQIQPSYSDAFGNKRQFGYVFFAAMNFSSVSLAWKVCDANGLNCVTNGNATIGQLCLATAVACSAPGSNDSSVVYISGTAIGTHTISVISAAGTTTSQVINVSKTAPILAYDCKAMAEKNGWEAKCVRQAQLKNSIIENTWGSQAVGGGQNGPFILDQSINQSSQTTDGSGAAAGYGPQGAFDLSVDRVHGLHGATGLVVAALNQALGIHRLSYTNLLFEDTNCSRYSHGFQKTVFCDFQQFSGTASPTKLPWTSVANPLADNINANHVTEVGGTPTAPGVGSWLSIANNNGQFQLGPYAVKDSIFVVPGSTTFANNNGDINDCNAASGNGAGNTEARALQGFAYSPAFPCFSSYSLARNLLLDNTAAATVFSTPTIWNNVASTDPGVFRNYNIDGNGGDYRLAPGSQYAAGGARAASDGTDLGADVAGILANDQAIRWGASSPMTISTGDTLTATSGVAFTKTLTVTGGTGPYVWSLPTGLHPPGAEDFLDYGAMPEPDRNNFHLNGPSNPKYFHVDAGLLWWMKDVAGHPWDGELVGSDYVKQWFTENTWTNAQSFKMYVNPVSLWKRYHSPGDDDVVFTPGPNKYSTTDNCGADNLPLIDNLGVRGELTGPFTDVPWQTQCLNAGGTLATCSIPDNTPYLLAQKWTKCTANDITKCTTEEDYWLIKGYGQAQWCPKSWNGTTYVTGTCSTTQSKVAGGSPIPNFACGVPKPPISDGLPGGVLRSSAPPMTLVDTTGVINGTPNVPGTYKFTVQVTDSLGRTATKTFTLTVQ